MPVVEYPDISCAQTLRGGKSHANHAQEFLCPNKFETKRFVRLSSLRLNTSTVKNFIAPMNSSPRIFVCGLLALLGAALTPLSRGATFGWSGSGAGPGTGAGSA